MHLTSQTLAIGPDVRIPMSFVGKTGAFPNAHDPVVIQRATSPDDGRIVLRLLQRNCSTAVTMTLSLALSTPKPDFGVLDGCTLVTIGRTPTACKIGYVDTSGQSRTLLAHVRSGEVSISTS